jgi:hypothetical protein
MRVILALTVGIGIYFASYAAESDTRRRDSVVSVREILRGLQSQEIEDRRAAEQTLLTFHRELTDGLMKTVEDDSSDSRQLAVELLAKLGKREAIPVFVKHVEYSHGGVAENPSLLAGYPCALALGQFGLEGAQGILMYLYKIPPDQLTDKAVELYAWVIVAVYGTNAGGFREGIGVVERATARKSNKENYQRLLDKMREITKNRVSAFDP